MVTTYTSAGDTFAYEKPRVWSDQHFFASGGRSFDLAPDGKRVAIFPSLDSGEQKTGNLHVTFLLNFFDELKRRAPGK
jgi:hypothetical protein